MLYNKNTEYYAFTLLSKRKKMKNHELIKKLKDEKILTRDEFKQLLTTMTKGDEELLYQNAREVREDNYGKDVYIRGLLEISNYCRRDCLYCGIRASNKECQRYRLNREQILDCAETGYDLGFRTFVMQGGEDMALTDDILCEIIESLKQKYPDCAVTLSIGERERSSYERYFKAGADRFLLRHESITPEHYSKLHMPSQTIENRVRCLKDLKETGFQTGCGIMIGSPFQTVDHIINDLLFMKDFQPHMVGMGPFIPHAKTPFKDRPAGSLKDTLHLLGIVRLMLPYVLLPSTTALGTIVPDGRELGLLAGANVVMPNLSPLDVRKKYLLYDGKISTGAEAAESLADLKKRVESVGYKIEMVRGDCKQ